MSTPIRPRAAIVPRLLRVVDACAYVGLGETVFRLRVEEGQIAQPTAEDPPRWKREDLDAYVDALPRRGEIATNPRRKVRAV